MEQKAIVEIDGIIQSVLQWNNWIELSLDVNGQTVKLKIPRSYCNPRKLYLNDYVRISGDVAKYNEDDKDILYSIVFAKAVVHKLLGKKKLQNDKLDYLDNFSFVGTIESATEIDDEFYQIKFKEANDYADVHTIYMLKEDFIKAMEKYDFRRLINIKGKTSIISYHKYFYDVPVSYIKNYALNMEYI